MTSATHCLLVLMQSAPATLHTILNAANYSDDPARQFDYYHWDHPTPVIVFVHGGAWRSEDKADHADVARSLATATGCAVAVPNYRLTPKSQGEFRHPGHAQDILRMLEFILHWTPHANARVSANGPLLLVGHSCSAHMLSSIFLDSGDATLKPTDELLKAVKGIVMSEGIYDLDDLLALFPKYREWFIEPAFGPATSYRPFSTLAYPLWPASAISWLVLHSKGDSLIDLQQSEKMYQHLLDIQPHDVDADFGSLIEEHDDVLRGTEYVKVIKDFARRTIGIQI